MAGIMQAPGDPKKKLLTPERVNKIADSLDNEAYKKKTGGFDVLMDKSIKNRKEVYDMSIKSADRDAANAARYRKLAAAKKKPN